MTTLSTPLDPVFLWADMCAVRLTQVPVAVWRVAGEYVDLVLVRVPPQAPLGLHLVRLDLEAVRQLGSKMGGGQRVFAVGLLQAEAHRHCFVARLVSDWKKIFFIIK